VGELECLGERVCRLLLMRMPLLYRQLIKLVLRRRLEGGCKKIVFRRVWVGSEVWGFVVPEMMNGLK
jgi:hypothetical protein